MFNIDEIKEIYLDNDGEGIQRFYLNTGVTDLTF